VAAVDRSARSVTFAFCAILTESKRRPVRLRLFQIFNYHRHYVRISPGRLITQLPPTSNKSELIGHNHFLGVFEESPSHTAQASRLIVWRTVPEQYAIYLTANNLPELHTVLQI
jgi:hypothetical protein